MKENKIFEGKSVDIAIENACKELRVSKDRLKYEIISYGSTGIFGIVGVKKAKIEVVMPETSAKHDDEHHEAKAGAKSLVDEAFSNGKKSKAPIAAKEALPIETASESDDDSAYEGFDDDEDDVDERMAAAVNELSDEVIEKGTIALQKIADAITEDASIRVVKEKDRLVYNIEGGDPSLLIGKRGQTLEAVQYLIDKLINRNADARVRVQVDVGGYLETRKKNLEGLALRLAEKAKKTGKPSTIGQMTAHDRRIVHLALKDDHGVRTQSMGEGYYRRLVIFPKRNSARRRRPVKKAEQAS
ncbi:RNA-binding cell elongation regulator Jag/EloR [Desulforegula conservatrix]|uniref:RNA-binding cell elongation regulator Jag/EloR n=1 Tax=Desulforegula conservatrix TaxID=153026 RepID=UPI0004066B1E|nr:RNA-binding cell elongation regulator Jag/EloR [Desulforegula conservatrix]